MLRLQELDELDALARRRGVLAKVVYHKLADPDHKKLRTHVVDGVLRHVNNGYCSLLEPKSISGKQFAEWIVGRNPGTYVAVHYIKLIDFTFGQPLARLARVAATGQRGLVGPADGPTWDSVQLQLTYAYFDGREAAFDIHTSWVAPDGFPGYVEQEVQFRFDNGVWNAHQRKRGVELTVEGRSPGEYKYTPNHHDNGDVFERRDERCLRGYGLDDPPFLRGDRLCRIRRPRPTAGRTLATNAFAGVQQLISRPTGRWSRQAMELMLRPKIRRGSARLHGRRQRTSRRPGVSDARRGAARWSCTSRPFKPSFFRGDWLANDRQPLRPLIAF